MRNIMKTAIYFDFDNTIFHNQKNQIMPQTLALLKALYEHPDVILGLATGRSMSKLNEIEPIKHYFDHFITINGAVIYIKDVCIHRDPIKVSDIEEVMSTIDIKKYNIGMVSDLEDAVLREDDTVIKALDHLRVIHPIIDAKFYLKHPVYQLWFFVEDQEEIQSIQKNLPKFKSYPWHAGGVDFLYPHISKKRAIDILKTHVSYDRLIAVGDGANDLEMIMNANIGIAMENSRIELIKEKAHYIAPHIDKDQLFDFFKSLNILLF
jgi:peptidyl-prolyl cis-trans isomerase B (cyclophilin B)